MESGICVAVVEDDASLSQALARILRIKGYTPRIFSSAEALLQDNDPAAIRCLVLDIQLPGMSGFELHQRLLRDGRAPPVIFITAYDDDDARTQAEAAHGVYLVKPFTGQALLQTVGRVLAPPPTACGAG
jgi:FixJ family two-component response regulator